MKTDHRPEPAFDTSDETRLRRLQEASEDPHPFKSAIARKALRDFGRRAPEPLPPHAVPHDGVSAFLRIVETA